MNEALNFYLQDTKEVRNCFHANKYLNCLVVLESYYCFLVRSYLYLKQSESESIYILPIYPRYA